MLELGAGCGLPSLVAATVCGAARVLATDSADLAMLRQSIKANRQQRLSHDELGNGNIQIDISGRVGILETAVWRWGEEDDITIKNSHVNEPFDWVIGADLFYSRDAFDGLVATLARLLSRQDAADDSQQQNRKHYAEAHVTPRVPRVIMAYHERSSKRSIQPLLDKWGLEAVGIPAHTFGFIDGKVEPIDIMTQNISRQVPVSEGITVGLLKEEQEVGSSIDFGPGMDSVVLFEVRKASEQD